MKYTWYNRNLTTEGESMSFKDYFSKEEKEKREQNLLEHKRENTKQLKVVAWVATAFIAGATLLGYGVAKSIGESLDTD
jgi:hypothetical protein